MGHPPRLAPLAAPRRAGQAVGNGPSRLTMAIAFAPLAIPAGAARLSRVPSLFLWIAVVVAAIVLLVVFPICNLGVPAGPALLISVFCDTLIGNDLCYAIVTLAMAL